MGDGRLLLPVVSDAAEQRVWSSELNRTSTRGWIVNGITLVEVHAPVPDIVHFQHGIERQFSLHSKTPMLVISHGHVRVPSSDTRCSLGATNRTANEEGRHGRQTAVEHGLAESIRDHVV